jgi:hypothetical protein
MIRVSLSDAEKSIDAVWLWYQRASAALRARLLEERDAAKPLLVPVFFGLAAEEVDEFFLELDYLAMLDLLSATEARIRVDFWMRVKDKQKDPLSRVFRSLVKEHDEKIALEEHILEAWVNHQSRLKSSAEDHLDIFLGEDVGGLRHEVHAAEDDVLDPLLIGRLARQLEGVADEVRKIDDGVLLIMVTKNQQPPRQRLLRRLQADAKLRLGKLPVNLGKRLLPDSKHRSHLL